VAAAIPASALPLTPLPATLREAERARKVAAANLLPPDPWDAEEDPEDLEWGPDYDPDDFEIELMIERERLREIAADTPEPGPAAAVTPSNPTPSADRVISPGDWAATAVDDEDDAPATEEGVLYFSPRSWAKLQYLCHLGPTEVGAMLVRSDRAFPLYVTDVVLIKQKANSVFNEFDDEALATFCDAQADKGQASDQYNNVWAHTHPGSSPDPSSTDETCFATAFGTFPWRVMFILARGGQTYARLAYKRPRMDVTLDVRVDWAALRDPAAHPTEADFKAWKAEYEAAVSRYELPKVVVKDWRKEPQRHWKSTPWVWGAAPGGAREPDHPPTPTKRIGDMTEAEFREFNRSCYDPEPPDPGPLPQSLR
jgi:proteasome lid subunit RPN8/RPN11